MILTINTNGTLIDEDLAAFFGKYKPRRVNITLYGADDGAYERLCHYLGGYEKTLRGIRLLREQGVDVKVGGSLTPANQKDLDRLLDLEQELGVPVRVDTYMLPAVRERSLPYDPQSRLEPEAAAEARIHALKREMGPELFPQYVLRQWSRRTARSRGRKRRYRWPAWRDGVPLPLTGRGRCGPASS